MQLFRSLFCFQGLDTRMRFFAICVSSFLVFILFSKAFSQTIALSTFISIVLTVIIGLTTQRRLKDSALNKNWVLAPTLSFLVPALIIIFAQHNSSYWLLLLPALCLAILLTYPSKTSNNSRRIQYILGYYGPVDLTEHLKQASPHKARRRIEPRLQQDFEPFYDEDNAIIEEESEHLDTKRLEREHINGAFLHGNTEAKEQHHNKSSHQVDIGEMIRLKLLKGKNAKITVYTSVSIVFAAFAFSFIISFFDKENNVQLTPNKPQPEIKQEVKLEKMHSLAMPDAFSLYLSPYKGLIISWQADEIDNGTLWSQADIQGDKSCKNISFTPRKSNKPNTFRTLSVSVEDSTNYFAIFSPLDTKALIQSIAFRGKFSLCGYSFSLKGSQSALGKHKEYAEWVDY